MSKTAIGGQLIFAFLVYPADEGLVNDERPIDVEQMNELLDRGGISIGKYEVVGTHFVHVIVSVLTLVIVTTCGAVGAIVGAKGQEVGKTVTNGVSMAKG